MVEKLVLEKRSLGQTGIMVSPIGLGVMQFSGGGGLVGLAFPRLSQEQKTAIVKAALEGGINWFDTAEMYGAGQSERSLSRALQSLGINGSAVIATKWNPILRTARNIPHSISQRLGNLHPYPIDLYYIHQPYSFSTPEAEMDAMADLVAEGKIRSVGVSNFDAGRMRRAQAALAKRGLKLAANQVHYSLTHRDIEADGTLQAAKELGVSIVAYTPLEYGLLTGHFHQDPALLKRKGFFHKAGLRQNIEATRPLINAMQEIAEANQATVSQVALNWLVNFHGDLVLAIPGASKVSQVVENAGALKFKLSEAELQRLDELSRNGNVSAL